MNAHLAEAIEKLVDAHNRVVRDDLLGSAVYLTREQLAALAFSGLTRKEGT